LRKHQGGGNKLQHCLGTRGKELGQQNRRVIPDSRERAGTIKTGG